MLLLGHDRFSQFVDNHAGLTPRVLSRRLAELQDDGLIEKTGSGRQTRYRPTEKGRSVLPILIAYTAYGVRHEAAEGSWQEAPRTPKAIQTPAH